MSTAVLEKLIATAREADPPRCSDFDDECPDVIDKVACWLYQPECGYCPYLAQEKTNG